MLRRIAEDEADRRRFFCPASPFIAASARSIVAALIASNPARTSGASCKCPARSMDSMRIGTRGRKRLPQTRSDVSHNMMSVSRIASP